MTCFVNSGDYAESLLAIWSLLALGRLQLMSEGHGQALLHTIPGYRLSHDRSNGDSVPSMET